MYAELTTPAVILDLDIAERNIAKMAHKLAAQQIYHRPHIKTHKSLRVAMAQVQAGAVGITVAKLSEAEVFVNGGLTDILIAYSIVGEDKLQRFANLHRKAQLKTTVDSVSIAEGLSRIGIETGKPVEVLIEVDGGLHRGGLQPGLHSLEFAKAINHLQGIRIVGLMGYFGNIYNELNRDGIVQAAKRESQLMSETSALLKQAGFSCDIVSAGSTPAGNVSEQLNGITEVRAGNYVFNDISTLELGLAAETDCALRVIATVISVPLPGYATIDAGSKTLTSDLAHHRTGHGLVVGYPEVQLVGLNEEHGYLRFEPTEVSLRVGDRVEIIPNHSCVIPNLNDFIFGVRAGQMVERISIDARGCNY